MMKQKAGRYIKCLNCGKPVYVFKSYEGKRGFFCKRKCYFEFIKKRRQNHLKAQNPRDALPESKKTELKDKVKGLVS